MPEVSDEMILRDLYDHLFHFRRVNVKSEDENEQWLCQPRSRVFALPTLERSTPVWSYDVYPDFG